MNFNINLLKQPENVLILVQVVCKNETLKDFVMGLSCFFNLDCAFLFFGKGKLDTLRSL